MGPGSFGRVVSVLNCWGILDLESFKHIFIYLFISNEKIFRTVSIHPLYIHLFWVLIWVQVHRINAPFNGYLFVLKLFLHLFMVSFCFVGFFCCCCRQTFTVWPWLSWNLPCSLGWPQTHSDPSACLCLQALGLKQFDITPVHPRTVLFLPLEIWDYKLAPPHLALIQFYNTWT